MQVGAQRWLRPVVFRVTFGTARLPRRDAGHGTLGTGRWMCGGMADPSAARVNGSKMNHLGAAELAMASWFGACGGCL
jgi:hypothetical protein